MWTPLHAYAQIRPWGELPRWTQHPAGPHTELIPLLQQAEPHHAAYDQDTAQGAWGALRPGCVQIGRVPLRLWKTLCDDPRWGPAAVVGFWSTAAPHSAPLNVHVSVPLRLADLALHVKNTPVPVQRVQTRLHVVTVPPQTPAWAWHGTLVPNPRLYLNHGSVEVTLPPDTPTAMADALDVVVMYLASYCLRDWWALTHTHPSPQGNWRFSHRGLTWTAQTDL